MLQRKVLELTASQNQLSKQVEKLAELRDEAVAKAQTAQKRIEVLVAMQDSEKQKYHERQDRLSVTNQAQNDKQPSKIETSEYTIASPEVSQPAAITSQAGECPVCNSFDTTRPWIKPGQTSMLSWQVSNADRIRIEPDIGRVSALGSRAVNPPRTTNYTLIAANGAGEKRQTCRVEVSKSLMISSDRIPAQVPLKTNSVSGDNKVLSEQQPSVSNPNTKLGKFLGYRVRRDESGKLIFIPVFENKQEE